MDDDAVLLALLVGFGILFIAALVAAYRQNQARRQRVWHAWAAAAESLGGESSRGRPHRLDFGQEMSIVAKVSGVTVRVSTFEPTHAREAADTAGLAAPPQLRFLRVEAKSSAPKEVALKVFLDDNPGAVRPGYQDVEVGEEVFDATFVVKATDEAFARAWINKTVRERLLEAYFLDFQLARGRVRADALLPGIPDDPEKLVAAIRAVAAFADGKQHVVRRFKRLAKRLGGEARKEPQRWASVVASVQGLPITVDTVEHGNTHYNVASASVLDGKLTPMVLTNDPHEFSPTLPAAEMSGTPKGYGVWTADPAGASAHIDDDVSQRIDALQPIKIRLDDKEVRVFLSGICPTVARMHDAVQLAAAIAANPPGRTA